MIPLIGSDLWDILLDDEGHNMSWSQVDLSTPEAIRRSVRIYRDSNTTNTSRGHIRHAWVAVGIPNQFAAMMRAAEMERNDDE